jgi:parallel beta-helix repeat protein/predicted outer membrane repeat protein
MKRLLILALYFIFWILAVISILTAYTPNVIAEEVHVYPGGSIQETINVANDGDVIIIHQGTYVENVDFLGKAISLRSTNPNDLEIVHSTVIDGNSAGSAVIFSNEEGSDSILRGITVRNGRADYETDYPGYFLYLGTSLYSGYAPYPGFVGGGIYCYSSSPKINNCIIIDNTGSGIYCYSSSPTIANCTISGNMASYANCTISGNMASYGSGGVYCDSSSPTITNCILWNNSQQEISIPHYDESSSPIVTYSDIQQETGIYPGVGNINADPLFMESGSGNYYLMPNSPCIDTGTSTDTSSEDKEGIIRPQGSGIDMGAYEYVETSSCTPRASFTANQTTRTDSLAVEFDASFSGGSQNSGAIFSWDFGDGTSGNGMTVSHAYTDYGSYDVSLNITTECGSHRLTLSDLIKIKSSQMTKEVGEGYPYTSIQSAIDDAGYGEMILVHDGTYIENINFKGKGLTVFSENGAATTIIDGSKSGSVVTFDHCEGIDSVLEGFTLQNGLASYGAGIYCRQSSPIITNCTIRGNLATSSSYCYYFLLFHSHYDYCKGAGGGIYCRFSSPTITNCTISGNTSDDGGGIYCDSSSQIMTNCTINNNTADEDGGGIYCRFSSPTITNCTVNGNTSDVGGGIYCDSEASPTITNCTISKNIAEDHGGGIYCSSSSPMITNCILWNNLPEEISGSTPTVTYSDIKQDTGVYPGECNINVDPLFVECGSGNYYLMPNSPCIDTGTSTNAPSEDKEGIVRPQGPGIDMGAYEYVEPSSCTPRASFTANQTIGTDSLTVEFDASSSGGSQYSGAIFSWNFGDGTSGSGLTVFHTYTDYGSHNVSLSISTECGSHRLTLSDLIKMKSSQVTKEVGDGFAYTSIQAAIDDSDYGEMILVHDGTYIENINFKGKGLTVFSENGAASTIIDGGENGSVVSFDNCKGIDSVLEGFTLQNGLVPNNGDNLGDGGGIHCRFSSPTITNCIIQNNTARGDGGGIYCRNYSSPTIINCAINSNTAEDEGGGIYCRNYSSPTLTNCTIIGNKASNGGGIYCYRSSPTITNCTINNNTAEDDGGGIYCDESSPTLTNCTIIGNKASNGAGIYCSYSSPTLTNCTISKNIAEDNGGGIFCKTSSSPIITNCILWNNFPEEIYGSSPTVTYSDIKQDTGIHPGEGNYGYPSWGRQHQCRPVICGK